MKIAFFKEGDKVENIFIKYSSLKIDSGMRDLKSRKTVRSFIIVDNSINAQFLFSVDTLFQKLYGYIIDFNNSLSV